MNRLNVSFPELFSVASTRALGGVGIGLLLADHLAPSNRRAVGWTLLAFGAITTLPLATRILPRLFADRSAPVNPVPAEAPSTV